MLESQMPFLLWLQSFSPALDVFFRAVNFIQTEDFFVLVLPIIFWCINKRVGAALTIVFLFSDYFSRFVKLMTGVPRPYQLDSRVQALDPQPDTSFPSAGVLSLTVFWGYLGARFRLATLWIIAAVLLVTAGIARMYLGAHYPTDVIGAVVIGFGIIALVVYGDVVGRVSKLGRTAQWILAIGVPILLAVILLDPFTGTDLGVLLGFGVGFLIEEEYVRFDTRGERWKQVLKVVVGLAIGLAARGGLKLVLPAGDWFRLARYAVLGLWVSLGAPYVFVLARLAEREKL